MISHLRSFAAATLLGAIALASISPAEAGVITEDFTGGTFDAANFEIASGTGSVASESWVSQSRGTLRTVADDLVGTASDILTVEADLTFLSGTGDIAFLGVRSTGLQTAPYNEPGDSVFLRIHNFQNGHTGISDGSDFNPYTLENFGDFFYTAGQTIRVTLTDDGSTVSAAFYNTVTEVTEYASLATSTSFGGHVVFSGGGNVAWDNISITHGNLGVAPVPAPAAAMMLLLGLAVMGGLRRA